MALQPQNAASQRDIVRLGFEVQHNKTLGAPSGSLHHHDFYEVYLLISGSVTYCVEGQLIELTPGDLLLISPQELHQVFLRPDNRVYERFVLWIKPQLVKHLSSEQSALDSVLRFSRPGYRNKFCTTAEEYQHIRSLLQQLHQETTQNRFGSDLLHESLLTQILVAINRLAEDVSAIHADHPSNNITQMVDYINRHYNEPITLDTLSELFYLSKSHISHAFKEQVGTSVYRYIIKKRLQIARDLLAHGGNPSQVSASCGFSDYIGFYRAFKAEYGTSPREYIQSLAQDM